MLKRSLFVVLITALIAISASAQKVYTPAKGSAERTAILSALRVPVEKALKQKVIFSADHFSVQGNWAYLSGEPQSSTGGKINYSKTAYKEQVESGAFDDNFFALLKKTGGKWKVVEYAIGCTDVCYLDWWKDHKAPKAIFGFPQ